MRQGRRHGDTDLVISEKGRDSRVDIATSGQTLDMGELPGRTAREGTGRRGGGQACSQTCHILQVQVAALGCSFLARKGAML